MMTIRYHLFFSSLAHAVLLFYLLSLPLHRGSLHFESFGDIFVHLTSQDVAPKQSLSEQKRSTSVATTARTKTKRIHKFGNNKKMSSVENKHRVEKAKPIAEQPENVEMPKSGIILKEEIPMTQVKEVKKKELPEAKMAQEEKPPQVEPVKVKKIEKIEETPKAKEIKEVRSAKLEAKVPEVKSEPEPGKIIETMAYDNVTVAEKPSQSDKGPVEKKEQRQKEEAKKNDEMKSAKKPEEPVKESEPEKISGEIAPTTEGQTTHPAAEKANPKAEVPAREGFIKESSSAEEPKGPEATNAAMTAKKMSESEGFPAHEASAVKKGLPAKRKREGEKAKIPGEGPLMTKTSEGAYSKSEEAPAVPLPETGILGNKVPAGSQSVKAGPPAEGKTSGIVDSLITEAKPVAKDEIGAAQKKPPLGIPLPDILLLSDIKIELSVKDTGISCRLFRRPHPEEATKNVTQKEVAITEKDIKEGPDSKRILRVAKADKGLYTFVMRNTANAAAKTDVAFHFFEKKKGDRKREFKGIELLPGAELKFKFVLPEAVFWDDESYFTGTIETSDSVTKFNNKTGLIWKEEEGK